MSLPIWKTLPRGSFQFHSAAFPHALLISLLLLILALVGLNVNLSPPNTYQAPPVWGTKPVLGYFSTTASLSGLIRSEAELSVVEFQVVQQIAREEMVQLEQLRQESQLIIQDPSLSLDRVRQEIAAMGYNMRVQKIVQTSEGQLKAALNETAYKRLVSWVEARWIVERDLHGILSIPNQAARTYEVYATRYDSGGSYTVALPDQCLKFANAGYHLCDDDGYSVGQGYSVFLRYEGTTAATVLEAGPWNVDDNYWAKRGDPQPRRLFADLPLGMPEAQAAYFDGYNGGLDQYGRKVTAPFGIDLARQVSIDIGLQPGVNDWITVSFLWTEGWGSSTSPGGTPSTPLPTAIPVIPIEVATPAPDGSITHIVQQGQTLSGIAAAYQITLQEVLALNGLDLNSVIHPGDELLIKPASATLTPTASTPTRASTSTKAPPTPRPTRIPATPTTRTVDPGLPATTLTVSATQLPGSALKLPSDPVLLGILGMLGAGGLLILTSWLLNRRR